MTPPERRPDDHGHDEGAATASHGTPAAVEFSADPRWKTTLGLFLAGPVILITHFLLVYLVVEAGCTGEGPGLRVFQPPVATIVTLAATAVAAVACVAVAVIADRRRRNDTRTDTEAAAPTGSPDQGALLLAGTLLALLGVVTVLFVGLPALVLPAC